MSLRAVIWPLVFVCLSGCARADQSSTVATRHAVQASTYPRIDGDFGEWRLLAVNPDGSDRSDAAADAQGDATGAFDLTMARAIAVGTELFIQFELTRVLTLQSGPESEGYLSLDVALPDGRSLAIDLRRRRVDIHGSDGKVEKSHWSRIGLRTAPTHSSERFELGFDLASLGLTPGDTVRINFGGSDALDEPLIVRLGGKAPRITVRPHERESGTDLRIANLNTHHEGLVDPLTRDQIARMVRAADADIYTFQEEWKTPADQIAQRLSEINPGDHGGAWNVHKVDGCIIATRWPITPAPSHNNRYAAAIVHTPGGPETLVVSIHPKCCGFDGSPEDDQRVEQMRDIARTIAEVRRDHRPATANAGGGPAVVVIGDWNLVGSTRPLLELTGDGAASPRLRHRPIYDLTGRHAYTYYDERGSFTPGTLDLVAYCSERLVARNRYLVETQVLPEQTLAELGLERGDSRGSDHLMLVADFEIRPSLSP